MSKYEDLKVYDVIFRDRLFAVMWSSPSLGFGSVTVSSKEDGSIDVDSEAMSNEFINCVMDKFREYMMANANIK